MRDACPNETRQKSSPPRARPGWGELYEVRRFGPAETAQSTCTSSTRAVATIRGAFSAFERISYGDGIRPPSGDPEQQPRIARVARLDASVDFQRCVVPLGLACTSPLAPVPSGHAALAAPGIWTKQSESHSKPHGVIQSDSMHPRSRRRRPGRCHRLDSEDGLGRIERSTPPSHGADLHYEPEAATSMTFPCQSIHSIGHPRLLNSATSAAPPNRRENDTL